MIELSVHVLQLKIDAIISAAIGKREPGAIDGRQRGKPTFAYRTN